MEYLFSNWSKIKNKLINKSIVIFLDYDGTLTPIVDVPKKAVLPRETKDLLNKLSKQPHCAITIISGRSLKEIKNIVGLKNITYVGNHGFEIEGPKIKFERNITPNPNSVFRNINDDLIAKLSGIRGVFIEDKGLTISVHYRLVDKKDIPELNRIFAEITNSFLARKKIRIDSGKKVYEIKPPLIWNKGKAVLWLLARQQFLSIKNRVFPVYIGDDTTDNDAFKVLRNRGLTIFVGESKVFDAKYYVKDAKEVIKFLYQFLETIHK